MTEITKDHAEWALVDRLRLLLEEPPHQSFNVTQSYALFTTILCWVMQRIRIKPHEIASKDDQIAHKLFQELMGASINTDPWRIHVAPTERIEPAGATSVRVPAPQSFEAHTAERFLVNLRHATAHGNARSVEAFNMGGLLVGFTFSCAEFERKKKTWEGKITLLEADMRRIGIQLARLYCDAIRHSHLRDPHFGRDAASIEEAAA